MLEFCRIVIQDKKSSTQYPAPDTKVQSTGQFWPFFCRILAVLTVIVQIMMMLFWVKLSPAKVTKFFSSKSS